MDFSEVKKTLKSHGVTSFGNKTKIKMLSKILHENETILAATECTYNSNSFTIFVVTNNRLILVYDEENQLFINFDNITNVTNDNNSITIFYDKNKFETITKINSSKISTIIQIIKNHINQIKKNQEHEEQTNELQQQLQKQNDELQQLNKFRALEAKDIDEYIDKNNKIKNQLDQEIDSKQQMITHLNYEIDNALSVDDLLDVGFYEFKYDFITSLQYKGKLKECQDKQKELVKNKQAVHQKYSYAFDLIETYEDYKSSVYNKISTAVHKQMIRCFNTECKEVISKVNIKNLEASKQKIERSFSTINKINEPFYCSINENYKDLKIDELIINYEYALKKEEEKELLKAQKEKEREEKALEREIKAKKKVIDKDIQHYQNVIEELKRRLSISESSEEEAKIKEQLLETEEQQKEKEKEKENLDYREANATAGYVYIISNIGAFGKDVVKIGVTRRLDPMERINELGSASVPFKFDVHALIFSDDAYKLENELHQFFSEYRVNKVNLRKEFFRINIEQIENKLKEYETLTIDFNREPEALEYYQTLKIEQEEIVNENK